MLAVSLRFGSHEADTLCDGLFPSDHRQSYRLQHLNEAAVISHKDGLKENYLPENLLELLRSEQKLGSGIDLRKLAAL